MISDPRVLKQIFEIKDRFELTVAGYGEDEIHNDSRVIINRHVRNIFQQFRDAFFMILGLNKIYYWYFDRDVYKLWNKLKNKKFDLIIANDANTLPFADKLSKNAAVVFDAHEYSPKEAPLYKIKHFPLRRQNSWALKKYIKNAMSVMTVSDGIAQEYAKKYNLNKPTVIPNVPIRAPLSPVFRNDKKIKLVYHGRADTQRGIHVLIKVLDYVPDNFELNLVLVGELHKISQLRKIAVKNKRIFFHDPVETFQIPQFLNQFDLGIYSLQPQSLNDYLALPNKFFEFIQARLGVIIGPSPEMQKYVDKYKFGLVSKNFDTKSIADQLLTLDKNKVNEFKNASHKAANDLCWENFAPIFMKEVSSALS